ncbi:MAG: hypothetical protein U9N85_09535, partial [Bacteroidota bacterium]|nr:hypothetical protein [Bacteroidota bacterium]
KLGTGQTGVGGKILTWSGAGWTGQPLIFLEDTVVYILQGTYSHRVLKIRADNLNIEWAYDFGDMLKGTGTVWYNAKADSGNKFVLIQGGRLGFKNRLSSKVVPSLRAINYKTGKNLWKLNSKRTKCYSRDVDASALIHNDTAYIGLENGIFTVFDPNPSSADTLLGLLQPKVFEEHMLYEEQDRLLHRGNLVTESSPSILGNRIYVSSGSGHLYGYNLKTRTIDFDFKTGSDMDGSPVVTDDSCLIVSLEKEYIPGKAGVFKIDPSKPADSCVVWYYALPNRHFAHWQGGVIGSATINDSYRRKRDEIPNLAAFSTIDGHLYVVKTKELSGDSVLGPQNLRKYPSPQLVYKYKISESISTPVFVQNKIVAASYDGVRLFEFDSDLNFKLLDHFPAGSVEATPAVYNGKVYIASKNGLLYVLGDKSKPVNPTYDYITPDSRLFFSDARQIIRLGLK